jgi:hypothetical protein
MPAKRYRLGNRVLFVDNMGRWASQWAVYYEIPGNQFRRFRSAALPRQQTREAAQADLDRFAAEHDLEEER